jgi:Flp pilus assembly protein TadD
MEFRRVFLRELLVIPNRLFSLLTIVAGAVLLSACATPSAAETPVVPVAVRDKIDSVAEAEIAQQEARATVRGPGQTSPAVSQGQNTPRRDPSSKDLSSKDESGALLRSLIMNGDLASAGAIASGLRSLKSASPMISLLIALVDFQQGNRVSGLQRIEIVRKDFARSRSKLAPKDALEIEYLCEVVSALFQLALGHESKGSASLARAAEIAPNREEHFFVATNHHRSRGRGALALRTMRELFAVVETPSVDSYLVKAGLESASGLADEKAVTLRRAAQQYPDSVRIEAYLAREEYLNGSEILGCEMFKKIYNVAKNDGDAAYNHGFCLSRTGSTTEAISVLEKAVMLNSGRTDLRTLLASLYLKNDRQPDADRLWRNFDSTEAEGIPENANQNFDQSSNRFLMQSMDAGRSSKEVQEQALGDREFDK